MAKFVELVDIYDSNKQVWVNPDQVKRLYESKDGKITFVFTSEGDEISVLLPCEQVRKLLSLE